MTEPNKHERLHLVNLDHPDLEGFVMQFNPPEFTEEIDVNYNRLSVLGLSHQPLQYTHTGNHKIRMELLFSALAEHQVGRGNVARNREAADEVKRFLLSACYPTEAEDVRGGAPPRILVVWPGTLSMTCKITKLVFTNQQFDSAGRVIRFTAAVDFEEVRDVRFLYSDARNLGSRRSTEGS